MRIHPRVNDAADWAERRLERHRWATAAMTVAAAAFPLTFWLPATAGLVLGVFIGLCASWGVGRDRRLVLEAQHDADQLTIGKLRGLIAVLQARPGAEAATKAIAYIPDDTNGGGR